ncbi:MAG: bifunctional DNA primase/polymerase [Hyphomonadaceae bacterium]
MKNNNDARARAPKPSDDLIPLIEAGYDLIPLHRFDFVDSKGRQRGKSPVDDDWNVIDYAGRGFDAAAWMDAGNNVGVRLRNDDLIVDVDPRNFAEGDNPLTRLQADIGVSLYSAPCVITGSGGFHFYLKKPVDWPTRAHVMPDYPGIEFKTNGTQVVAPGSMHPNGKRYSWEFGPVATEKKDAPRSLLDVVKRKPKAASAEAGVITPEELAQLLAVLPPEGFRGYNEWLYLMMASHHATAGEGGAEFATWASSDPAFSHTQAENEEKWRTLDDSGGVTYGTLFNEVAKREGGADALYIVRQSMAVRDFADIEPPDGLDAYDDGRRHIRIIPGELSRVLDEAEQALIDAGADIFVRGSDLVRFARVGSEDRRDDIRRSADSLVLIPVTNHWLRERMGRAADFLSRPQGAPRKDGKSQLRRADPTLDLANQLLARQGEWKFRPIRAVLQTPTLTSKGELLQEPGYDAASGLYLDVRSGAFPLIDENPSMSDARSALEALKKPIRAFPFVSGAARSVALSAILTGLIRPSLEAAPMHAFDAPAAGTGKSLLVDTVAIITTGRKAPAMAFGASNEETEKRLASAMMAGDQLLMLDNVTRPVEGELLCSMLTQSTVTTRVLGKSTMVYLPSTCLVTVTGNNLTFTNDVSRRVVTCRMDAQLERPDQRRFDFRPTDEALANRPALVAAGLTVLRAYIAAGRPLDGKLQPLGDFNEWRLVREALVWLGEEDPALTVDTALALDPELETLRRVLTLWHDAFGSSPVTVTRIGQEQFDEETSAAQLKRLMTESWCQGKPWTGQKISAELRKRSGRVAGNMRLAKAGEISGVDAWRVEAVG